MNKMTRKPTAYANLAGNKDYPDLKGKVEFYDTYGGTIVVVEVAGMNREGENESGFHGFHIHEGGSCTGTPKEPFANAEGHYNPNHTWHPQHAGDLPPLLDNNGNAWMMVYTDRFYPEDVIGKTVIIHERPDDFNTQPSGNSGAMIACGEIIYNEMKRI